MLAAGAMGDVGAAPALAAAIVGGTLAAASHGTKAGSRVLINTSPEPFSNWVASIGEDVIVIAGLWTALNHPVVFIVLLVLFIGLMIYLLPKLWRGIKKVFGWILVKLGVGAPPADAGAAVAEAPGDDAEGARTGADPPKEPPVGEDGTNP